jgi:hypothetical protein
MTTDATVASAVSDTSEAAAQKPVELPISDRTRILIYLGTLVFILSFGGGGLIGRPIFFMLKNKLHLGATQVSLFYLVAAIPGYLAFFPGFVRDLWNPLGLRDRGYMIIFGGFTALLYAIFAFVPVSVPGLLIYSLTLGSIFQFVVAGQTGLSATIARQHVMSGQMSTVMNVVTSVAGLIPLMAGGYLSDYLKQRPMNDAARELFLGGAAIMGAFALFAVWRPKVVYDNVRAEHGAEFHPLRDLKRLVRHYPVYPALGIWLLWNFAPGSDTALQYHLQNTLHATDAEATNWNVLFSFFFIPTFLLFGWLCRRVRLRTLLFWGTLAAVPQMVPLLFVKSVPLALLGASASGLMGGVATAAYLDLMIRSAPRGLEGTMLMASNALYVVVQRVGDVLGTKLYEQFHTFTVCAISITVVYALIIPALWLVPKRLTATPDGVAPEGGFDAETDRPELAI